MKCIKLLIVIPIISCLILSSCSTLSSPKPFEGIITYQIIPTSNIGEISDQEMGEYTGTKMVKYIKGSNHLSKTFNSNDDLLEERLVLGNLGKKFLYSSKKDSIPWYYCSEDYDNMDIISTEKGKDKTFLKHSCETTTINVKIPHKTSSYPVEYVYYCSKDYPRIIEDSKCSHKIDSSLNFMILAWEVNGYPVCDRKFIPIKIEAKKLDNSIFKLSKSLPLKKI